MAAAVVQPLHSERQDHHVFGISIHAMLSLLYCGTIYFAIPKQVGNGRLVTRIICTGMPNDPSQQARIQTKIDLQI